MSEYDVAKSIKFGVQSMFNSFQRQKTFHFYYLFAGEINNYVYGFQSSELEGFDFRTK